MPQSCFRVVFRRPYHTLAILASLLVTPTVTSANETDQEMPVSAVGGTVHADLFTGTATTSIPIAVPPGRGGVHPNLALVYNSANGNGWVGLGWKLEKSVIERQTKFGLNYAGDAYVFRLAGINVDLVNIGNNQYRAKIEGGFTRVQKLTATDGKPYFLATDKTGQKFYFGRTAATRVADPSDANKIFRWCLERVEDPDGNYMTISYTGDQGQGYLSRIDYTGHGSTRPTNSVIFHLETRTDAVPMYTSHFLMKTAKRLKTIEVRANNRLVRAYKLTYTSSAGTSRSLLRSVTQYGKDATIRSGTITGGSALPAVSMTYAGRGTGFSTRVTGPAWSNAEGWGEPKHYSTIAYPDLNGDGKADICGRGGNAILCFLGTGTGFSTRVTGPAWSNAEGWGEPKHYSTIAYPDLNGDGKADICGRGGNAILCFLGTGTGFSTRVTGPAWSNAEGWGEPKHYSTIAYPDLNGDGKADICGRGGNAILCFLGTGTGFSTRVTGPAWSNAEGWGEPKHYSTIAYPDLNGDGKADICGRGGNAILCFLGTGTGFSTRVTGPAWSNAEGWGEPKHYSTIAYPDLNGDGKADICGRGGNAILCFLGTGTGFSTRVTGPAWSNAEGWGEPKHYSTIAYPDLNGDGKADICGRGGNAILCFLGTGTGFSTRVTGPAWGNTEGWGVPKHYSTIAYPDLNGNGKADVCGRGGVAISCGLENANGVENLQTLTNGLGATTTLTYKPSTQYANTQLPYPTQTVATITTNDGNGNVAATAYTYSGGYHHIGEREFRGFHYAKVTGPAGPAGEKTITETWFHQGNDLAVGTNNPAVAHGYLKGAPYRVKVTDARGNRYSETTTTYTADANGRAPFFTPPASVVIKTCDGNATCRTTRTDYTYDAYGNVTQERQYGDTSTTTDDRTVVRTFAANTTKWIVTLPTRETIRAGLGTTGTELARTDFYYDGTTSCAAASVNQTPAKGHMTRSVRWLSGATTHPETRMAYNSQGNLICTRDANGHTTTTGYDPTGTFVTTVTNAQGHVTTTAYYGVNGVATTRGVYGQVRSVTDANGAVVSTEYDALGRRTKVTQPDGFWTTTSYVSFGTVGSQHVRTASQLGLSTWTYFDGLGRTIKQQSTGAENSQIITETQYDARGAVTRTSVPYSPIQSRRVLYGPSGSRGYLVVAAPIRQWTTSTYDPLGRVLQTTHPDGTRTRACYDDGVTVTLDAKNHRKRTTRDAYGRVVKVEEYTGIFSTCTTARGTPYATTTYAHDRLGNLTTVTDALGNRTTLTYDTLSRKTSMRDPDLGTWTYAYDRHGNLIRQTDAKRQQTHFRYDALHRRTQKDYGTQKAAGAGDVRYTYDGLGSNRKGRLQQVVDTSGTTQFHYDRAGRVTQTDKVVGGTVYTTRSAYDGLGRVTHLSYPTAAGIATRVGTATNFGANVVAVRSMTEHQGTLYLVGSTTATTGTTSALYRLNPTTGVATRVGTATNFGVNESIVPGLASHQGTLYMVGNTTHALYTLNPTTGVAARVGTATKFGVNEAVPRAFTSHQGTLYMAGKSTQALYTLNPTTGVAARVGTATKFGVKESHVRALASYQGALYMVGGVTRRLYRVDPTTGVATPVSRTRGFGQRLNPNGLAAYQGRLYMTINTHQASAANALYTLSPPPPPPRAGAALKEPGTATRVGTAARLGVNEGWMFGLTSHNGTLYMAGTTTDALYTVNPSTGRATRVGTATKFGINEDHPTGLTSHQGKLYMVGYRSRTLYTVNPTTGVATRVGTAGANEDYTLGLASHNGQLYMLGDFANALYTLNTTTGAATRVGTARSFGVNETTPYGLVSHNGDLYMTGAATDALYRLDPATGVATRVGTATKFGVNENYPMELASHHGTLYMLGNSTGALYTLSLSLPPPRAGAALQEPGLAARIGTATKFGVNTRWVYGLASHNGHLYMTASRPDALFTVNPTTGVATRIGTATKFGVNEGVSHGLASHGGTLYMVGSDTDALYTVNPTTGVATRVGTATKFGVNEGNPTGLTSHDGTLYMVGDAADALYTVNPTTGVATRVGTATKFGVKEGVPHGLASHGGTLYLVGWNTGALHTLNPATGVATRVGRGTKFGLNEGKPTGMTSHDGRLYVLGNINGALYTLSLSLPPSTVTYTYSGPQLQSVQEGSTTYARYSGFNALGQPSTVTLGNGTTTNYTYDSRNYRLKTLRTVKGSTVLQNLGYTFDAAGNVTSLTDPRHGTQTFAYDGLDRLTEATGGYGTATYTYNQIGNMLHNEIGEPAKRVGTATQFGVNETWPKGLASHNGKLYMVGRGGLYTLNPTTGGATRVGRAYRFGVGETWPLGLASHNGKLYMLGYRNKTLYTVNPTTGVATRVGTATRFGVNEWDPRGLASHNGKLYMTGNSTDALYTLNPTTGVATRVGTVTKFGVNETYSSMLASHNGKLYMLGISSLYTVNPTTGVATRVGKVTGLPTGLASHNGKLYRVDSGTDALHTLNPASMSASPYTYNPSGTTSTRPHAVTRAGTKTYSYDANGNMLLGDGRIMTYDNENRLSTVRKNGATTTFVYDGDGGRVKKTVTSGSTTTTTTYIGKLYVCEGTSCSRLIYAGTQRIALVPMPPSGRTPSPSYFHPDHLGSTSVLTNAQGVAEEHNSYRPYGQLHTHTGTADVAYKYTGQERDPSTGLYFYNARYYDPALGRFISPDTLVESPLHPQTLNRYAYAGNNPVLYNDPTGHCFLVCIIIGAIVGTVSAGIASDWDPGATLLGGAIGAFSGGVGGKVGGFVAGTVKGTAGSILGGAAGGAAAGGTSSLLYRAAGYNVNVGLAIGAGAAAGLVGGAVGFGGYEWGLDPVAAYFAGAASSGAVSSTIMGGDPGIGALYAVAAAGIALGVQYAYNKYQSYLDNKARQLVNATAQDKSHVVLAGSNSGQGHCTTQPCYGVGVQWIQRPPGHYPGSHDPYNFFLDIFCDCKLTGMFFDGGNPQLPGRPVNIPTGKIPLDVNIGLGGPVRNFYLEIYGPLGTGRLDIPFRWAPPQTRSLPHTAI